jgi:putative FmdB family regulatory protein
MPFYEYECPKCGYHDEVLQKINDKPLQKCPSCGKSGLRKLMSAPVFRLKGSGWYETDFKSDKENKRNLAGAEKEEAKSEAKADAKADTKADAKTDAKPEAAKPEKSVDKSESSKPVAEKASRSASKPVAKRAKPKVTPKRPAKRQARR